MWRQFHRQADSIDVTIPTTACPAPLHCYCIALGSNRASGNHISPSASLRAGLERLTRQQVRLLSLSPIYETAAIGPSLRRYSNGAAMIETALPPIALLRLLKQTERAAGRRAGQRWGARPLDLDIILWSGGKVRSRTLDIPHRAFRDRLFVLEPLATIAADWRDPITGLTVRQLLARAKMPKPVDRRPARL